MPEIRESIMRRGNLPAGGTPQQFEALIASDLDYWGEVIRSAKVKAE